MDHIKMIVKKNTFHPFTNREELNPLTAVGFVGFVSHVLGPLPGQNQTKPMPQVLPSGKEWQGFPTSPHFNLSF
jgi:hypothetical protein